MAKQTGIVEKLQAKMEELWQKRLSDEDRKLEQAIKQRKAAQEAEKKKTSEITTKMSALQKECDEMQKKREMLFRRTSKWALLTQEEVNDKIGQPLLFLLRDNLEVDVYENVVPGPLEIKNKRTGLVQGHLILSPKKLHTMKFGESAHLKCWIAYEREGVCYPTDIIFDSQAWLAEMTNLMMNVKTYAANRVKGGQYDWIWLAGGAILLIIIAIGLLSMFGVSLDKVLLRAAPAAETIAQNLSKGG